MAHIQKGFFMNEVGFNSVFLDLSVSPDLPPLVTFDTLLAKKEGSLIGNIESIKGCSEIVPLTPSPEMLKAALGEKYTDEQAFELKKMWRNMIHEHQKLTADKFYGSWSDHL